jgi:hypothetical protein
VNGFRSKVARAPNGGYGANRYQPEEFGIDPQRERERATHYVERFGIASKLVEVSAQSVSGRGGVDGQRGVLEREQWSRNPWRTGECGIRSRLNRNEWRAP